MTTAQIYKGSIAFIVLQLIMVAVVIAMPNLVTGGIDVGVKVDADKALETMGVRPEREAAPMPSVGADPASSPAAGGLPATPSKADDAADAMKALQDAVKEDAAAKKP